MASGIIHGDTGVRLEKDEMEGGALHVVTADLDVATHKIINVVDPTANQHAVTKHFLDLVTTRKLADVQDAAPANKNLLIYKTANTRYEPRLLAAADIPNLNAAKITTGTFPIARIHTYIKAVSISFIIDGGGVAITTGQKGHLILPFDFYIQGVVMLADQTGSIVVDIWKDSYTNFPPTDGDSITASAPPTISSAQKSSDYTLTGWTRWLGSNDVLAYNVDSVSDITRVTIALQVLKY